MMQQSTDDSIKDVLVERIALAGFIVKEGMKIAVCCSMYEGQSKNKVSIFF